MEILILVIVLILGVIAGTVLYFVLRLNEKIFEQNKINQEQAKQIQEIKERILLTSEIQNFLKGGVEKTRDLLEELKRTEAERSEREKEFLERIKRVDEIVAGTTTKGFLGEEILRETFKKLPPEMIETNFRVKGKVVEFALILPNQKRLAIDSKWPAGDLLKKFENEENLEKKKEIGKTIEKEVIKRIKEVKEYIDPDVTWSQAICAIPDSVYHLCQQAHILANKENVILMPYSMVLPLILYMYRLHLQYAISLDLENLQGHLTQMSKSLQEMESILENKIFRGTTMVQNAYLEYKNLLSKIKNSLVELTLREGQLKLFDKKKLE